MHRTLSKILVAFLIAVSADAADLHGVVTRPAATPVVVREATRYRNLEKTGDEAFDANCRCNPGLFAVISLRSDTAISFPPSPDTASLTQKDKRFEPSVLAVGVNSTVSFPNLDPFYHNVFSYSKTKKFDLGKYKQGNTKYVTFDKPGIVQVFCEIHHSMRAYVHIFDTPYFAVSDDQGQFVINDVSKGTYTMTVWQEGQADLSQVVTIAADSSWVEIP